MQRRHWLLWVCSLSVAAGCASGSESTDESFGGSSTATSGGGDGGDGGGGTTTSTTTSGSGGGDPCEGVLCTAPPADACVDGATLRTYAEPGACSQGQCSYAAQDTACGAAKRCEGAACLACNEDLHCGALCAACGGVTPRCLVQGDSGSCVGCVSQADCVDGYSCDATSHSCAPSGGCATALADAGAALAQSVGWKHQKMDGVSGSWKFDSWQYGVVSSGPGSCQAGGSCWATNLTGNYVNCQRADLRTPSLNVEACAATNLKLAFWHWYDFWSGSYGGKTWFDGGLVELSGDGGVTWVAVDATPSGTIAVNPNMGASYACLASSQFYVHGKPGYVGQSGAWEKVEATIPQALRTAKLMVRFAYASGVSKQTTSDTPTATYVRPGWYLDGVAIEEE